MRIELVLKDESNLGKMLHQIGRGEAQFAAYNLGVTDSRRRTLQFSEPYMELTQQVIYRRGSDKPKSIEDLYGKDIILVANSAQAEMMGALKIEHPELTWRELDGLEQLDLLESVHSERAEITIVDSTAFTVNKNIYPRARHAFDLPVINRIAWAFPKNSDQSLIKAANRFLLDFRQSGQLQKLVDKYFFDNKSLDEAGALTFSSHIDSHLPKWEQYFRDTADKFGVDWLLLAAMSYQESHWRANARSYTGVRGLMMLTRNTAKQIGIKNRTDPQQSIYGGAKYFTQITNRLPTRIKNPDRLWMALAAYNVGLGHLEDARILTQRQGGNPYLWEDVKKRLPLLSKKKYYKKTKHGYARGWEPVSYVENIRKYHNILVWYNQSQQKRLVQKLPDEASVINLSDVQYGEFSQL
jgi:membrane-bound lytic murein transglycosylase F